MKETYINLEKALKDKRNRLTSKKNWDRQKYLELVAKCMCVNCTKRKALKTHVRCKVCFYKQREKIIKRKFN